MAHPVAQPIGRESAAETPFAVGHELELAFHGTAREYFRIWAVNLCLTLLTFGVFSAWAKVRKKRYFYSHTTLDGTPFQYLGEPGPILRGRIVAVALFLVYYSSTHFVRGLFPYVVVLGAALAPWVLIRSVAFNARYSSFRNMTFRFEGTYAEAVRRLHGWGLIPALVVLTVFDWFGHPGWALAMYAVCALAFPFWQRRLRAFIVERTSYGGKSGMFWVSGGRFFGAYLRAAALGSVVSLLAFVIIGGVGAVLGTRMPNTALVGVAAVVLYSGYVLVSGYLQARITNLVWNGTRLGPLRFRASLTGGALGKLYVTNTLAVLGSAGLLIPWAVIRTTRYRIEHLRVLQGGPLSEFVADEPTAVRAAGAEVGALFELDFSL